MKLDDQGNIDYGYDPFQPPDPNAPQKRINPITGLPVDTGTERTTDPTGTNSGMPGGDAPPSTGAGAPETNPIDPAAPPPISIKPTAASATPDYLLSLIRSGMSPKDAAAKYNADNNTTEAKYYDPSDKTSGHATIGLSGGYLTDEDQWSKLTQRMAEGTGGTTTGGSDGGSALSTFLLGMLGGQSTSQTDARKALFNRLMGQADELGKPVDANDPTIKNQTDAYHGTIQRSLQDYRTRAAERAHAEGVGSGSFDSQIGNAEMAAGRSEGTFTSGLMTTELQSRRAQLATLLGQAGTNLSDQDRADLQAKVTAIDGLLRDRGLDLTDKGLNITQLLGQGALDNNKKSLQDQRDEFYDKFGADNAFSQAQLDYLWKTLGLK